MQLFYTVRPGDTLHQIASRWELPVEVVIAANNLLPPFTIYSGKQLSIPPGVNVVRVEQGDTLDQLSHFFHVSQSVIIEANKLQSPDQFMLNQQLTIPPGEPYYLVQKGDTLYQLAKSFNVLINGLINPQPIRIVNQLKSNRLQPGMKLKIPYTTPLVSGLLAFIKDSNGVFDLFMFNPSNGSIVQVTDGLAESYSIPYWSCDNKKIAFVGKNSNLYIISLENNQIDQIDQLEANPDVYLEWSPDSQKLAFTKNKRLNMYDVHNKVVEQIGNIQDTTDINWFPSGEEVMFQASDKNGVSQIYRIHTNGSGLQQLTKNTNGCLNQIRLSSDGSYALYTKEIASIIHIQIYNLSTGVITNVKGGPIVKNSIPVWSPKSNRIAYIASGESNNSNFSFIKTTNGDEDRTCAISSALATSVSWSSDGRLIAYLSGSDDRGAANELWAVDIKHPAPCRLVEGNQITSLSWSK